MLKETTSSLKPNKVREEQTSAMMENNYWLLIVWFCMLFSSKSNAQAMDEDATMKLPFSTGQYSVGLASFSRFATPNVSLGFEQSVWAFYGGGVSALWYTSQRVFWSLDVGYAAVNLTQERVRDIRYELDPVTNQVTEVEYGTRTEEWHYRYITVPINVHYLLTRSKGVNLYAVGGIALDWIPRFNREITATHDGRFNYVSAGKFKHVSATLRGGIGLYLPVGRHFLATVEPMLGNTFFSEYEADIPPRDNGSVVSVDLRLYYRFP